MELRVLRYFLIVAREENITKAAQVLHITQPTLSRQLAQLEEELGVRLFIRKNHNIVLTEDGMMLRRRAQELISLAEKTKRDFLCRETEISGEITIGSGEFLSTKYLSEIIASFHKAYPLVTFEIYSGNESNVKDYIERGLLDIGLMLDAVDICKYEFVSMPVKERWGVLVCKDSELAHKEQICPEDLKNIPLIMSAGEFPQSKLTKWLGSYAQSVEIAARGNLLYNEAMLAASNIGVVICIQLNCTYDGLRVIPLFPAMETETVLAWKKDQTYSAATAAFIDHAKKYLKGISNNTI